MKKFIIISVVLILLAAGAFGYSLYHFMEVNDLIGSKVTATADSASASAATEAAKADKKTDATQAKTNSGDTAANGGDVFAAGYDKAKSYIGNMTTEQKVGQTILGICSDTTTISSELNRYSLSGMLFEMSNFEGGMTSNDILSTLRTASSETKIKPIYAAQEEGGSYTTISDLGTFTEYDFNAPRTEFDAGGLDALKKQEDSKTTMLKAAGFNLNLAPVVDLCGSPDQMMYSRSIGDDVAMVSAYAEYAAKNDQAKGVSITLKHFPGNGAAAYSNVDERDAQTIRTNDYTPFKKGAEAGAHFIMVSNIVVKNIDGAHTAALSKTIHTELRDIVGFKGLVITDVLDDADYSAYAEGNKTAVQAILAGNDIVLVRDYATAYNDILAAVNAGTISEAQLDEVVTRILAYKYTSGIMQ